MSIPPHQTFASPSSSLALLLIICAGCAGASPVSAPTASGPGAPSAHVIDPVDAREREREEASRQARMFPAGRGTTLMTDQLWEATRNLDRNLSVEEKISAIRKTLGVSGEPLDGGDGSHAVVFYGITARTPIAPYGCYELTVSKLGAMTRVSDHKNCGLPYASDPEQLYVGSGPRRTAFRLKKALTEITPLALSPADAVSALKQKLGPEDRVEGIEHEWTGIGPRSDEAPFSCHSLVIDKAKTPRLERVELGRCGLAWPPSKANAVWDAAPAIEGVSTEPALAECKSKCTTAEICVIDQRMSVRATQRHGVDDNKDSLVRATYLDGQPAPVHITSSCAPIPASCGTTPTSACFFPPGGPRSSPPAAMPSSPHPPPSPQAGPCPKSDAFGGYAFKAGSPPVITCFSRIGALKTPPGPTPPMTVPLPPPPPPPRPITTTTTAASPKPAPKSLFSEGFLQ